MCNYSCVFMIIILLTCPPDELLESLRREGLGLGRVGFSGGETKRRTAAEEAAVREARVAYECIANFTESHSHTKTSLSCKTTSRRTLPVLAVFVRCMLHKPSQQLLHCWPPRLSIPCHAFSVHSRRIVRIELFDYVRAGVRARRSVRLSCASVSTRLFLVYNLRSAVSIGSVGQFLRSCEFPHCRVDNATFGFRLCKLSGGGIVYDAIVEIIQCSVDARCTVVSF